MRTLLTALALFCAVNLSAADLKWAMKTQAGDVVFMTDVSYLLYGDGVTTFSIVRKDGSTIANLEKVTFEKLDPTGVGAVVNDNEVFAKIVERTLTIAGCEAGIEAAVVNVGGKVVKTVTTATGKTDIDISDLPNGTYLLKVGGTSVKFLKK